MNDEIKIEKDSGRDMTPKLIGETYMKYPTEISPQRYRYGLYECQYCGKEFEAMTKAIKSGHTKSCGCQKGGRIHGLTNNQFYVTWNDMIRRCTNLKHKSYPNYGGRGITVCDVWTDVRNFITWCESTYIEGMSLDRIDNDGNYSPDNVRWADASTQALNKRMHKSNTSGFVGVSRYKGSNKWVAQIMVNKVGIHLGYFNSVQEAVQARDNYIIENNLPHMLSTDYKKEN